MTQRVSMAPQSQCACDGIRTSVVSMLMGSSSQGAPGSLLRARVGKLQALALGPSWSRDRAFQRVPAVVRTGAFPAPHFQDNEG